MDERLQILKMIEEGKVTADEGVKLLEALETGGDEITLGKTGTVEEESEEPHRSNENVVIGKREQSEGFDEEHFHISLLGKKEVIIDALKASNVKIITEERDNIFVRHLDYSSNKDNFTIEVEDDGEQVKISETIAAFVHVDTDKGFVNINGRERREGMSILDSILEGVDDMVNFGLDVMKGARSLFGKHELHIHMPSSYRGDLTIKGIRGDFQADKIIADGARISMVSGNVYIGELMTNHSVIKVTSSDVRLDDFRGDVIVSAISGNLTMGTTDLTGDISAKLTSGDIELTMPASTSFGLKAVTTSGDIDCHFPVTVVGKMGRNKIRGMVGNEDKMLTLKTISGDIIMNKA